MTFVETKKKKFKPRKQNNPGKTEICRFTSKEQKIRNVNEIDEALKRSSQSIMDQIKEKLKQGYEIVSINEHNLNIKPLSEEN